MARKSAQSKTAESNNGAQSAKLREAKVVRSRNFYPAHYLNEVFADDIKGLKASGDAILRLRQDALKIISTIVESKISDEEAQDSLTELAKQVFSAFGYYAIDSIRTDTKIDLELPRETRASRIISVDVEKRIQLKDDSELLLVMESSRMCMGANCETVLNSSSTKALCENKREDEEIPKWKEIVKASFDSDLHDISWIILNTGSALFLFERGHWSNEGEAWLEADLRELWELNSTEYAKMVEVLYAPPAFSISSPESWHNIIATNAHKKATEVSRALRDTVRQSVELLANEVLVHHTKKGIDQWKGRSLEKADHRELCAREVFEQVLRVVYRMLFILVVEGQPQSKRALPIEAQAYQQGLSLEKLRDLENTALVGDAGSQSSFIWQTLKQQAEIYFRGFNTEKSGDTSAHTDSLGFSFPHLGIHLFDKNACTLLNDLNFSDRTMQQVLRKLSLAQTGTGKAKRTHRVYYGSLSLNRLGEVYEGLLSLRPQILEEKMYALARDPKEHAPKLISHAKAKEVPEGQFELDDAGQRVVRQKGEFALTPTGFERKLSASYYTPEELTQFLASESVECLLGKDTRAKDYAEICTRIPKLENLKICEPAMGNGAFCNAVVNEVATRLAKLYVHRAELVLHENIKTPLTEYEANTNFEHQKGRAKEHILRNGVYGVDLNPTAVELARVSLWLNALHKGGDLPYLDLKLRCGNSLVGVWINRYRAKAENAPHFLFPMPEMLDAHLDGKYLGDNKRPFLDSAGKAFVQDLRSNLAAFSKQREDISDSKLKTRVTALTTRIAQLYGDHRTLRGKLQDELMQDHCSSPAARQTAADSFLKKDTAYNQLRGMMDLWCALWFWPHSEIKSFPKSEEILRAMEFYAETPIAYGGAEHEKQILASALKFLSIARRVALKEKFFHWDLEFPEVFEQGGFDLVLGNPPWAPVRWDEGDFFDTIDFGISSTEGDAGNRNKEYDAILKNHTGTESTYKDAWCNRNGHVSFLNSSDTYEFKDSSTTNTYKFFYQRFLQATRKGGIHAMIAQDGLLTDDGNATARPTFYAELERGFRFWNELQLFAEVDHHVQFFAWISQRGKKDIDFSFIDNLYHPDTVNRCRQESGKAPYRGMKDENNNWEVRGHPKRIVHMNRDKLAKLALLTGAENPTDVALPIVHGDVELAILATLAAHPKKIVLGNIVIPSRCFEEDKSPKLGWIKKSPCHGKGISRSVLTGPNFFVANPAYKQPNPGCKNNLDYSEIDLESTSDNFFPDTLYETTEAGLKSDRYNKKTPWGTREVDEYRIFIREFVGTASNRTLQPAIFPPLCGHIHAIVSLAFQNTSDLVGFSGCSASLVFDFLARSISGGHISQRTLSAFPALESRLVASQLYTLLQARTLRLNCISSHYSDLWKKMWKPEFANASLPSSFSPESAYSKLSAKWQRNSALRDAKEREQTLCEIDVIVAILFGISKQDLLDLYRSQFAVLQKNLQDLPNQTPDPEKFHFPRYKAMSDGFDACMNILNGTSKPKRVA